MTLEKINIISGMADGKSRCGKTGIGPVGPSSDEPFTYAA
jgi:hypothetical protein